SLCCDPLWTMISGIGFLAAFAVVALSPLRIRPALVRCLALTSCVVLLTISAIGYVHTLTQYSARVWFSDALAYVPQPTLASIVFISPRTAGGYYGICALGWLLGILLASGRVRVLVMAGLMSFAFIVAYSATFLLMLTWWLPLPLYVEHSLFPLFTTAAIAGYWVALHEAYLALRRAGSVIPMKQSFSGPLSSGALPGIFRHRRLVLVVGLAAVRVAAVVPAAASICARRAGPTAPNFYEPFPDEPELLRYLGESIGLRVGSEFRGSVTFVANDEAAMYNLWIHGIPTADEYNQFVTPQAHDLSAGLLGNGIVLAGLNAFVPWIKDPAYYDALFKTLPALGVRYIILHVRLAVADQRHFPFVTIPRHVVGGAPAKWFVYELPNPNVGTYSPTEIVTAKSGAEIIAALEAPHFDFTKQVALSTAINEPLVPAKDMRLSLIRGGLHVSGSSDGTSLDMLPQQFSNCLRARDSHVRLVRADLLMTGVVFSGNLDTDILFDYGIFSYGCRRIDLAELKRLIEPRMPKGTQLFVDWDQAAARLRAAGVAMGLLDREAPREAMPSEEPAPPGAAITKETILANLPQRMTSGFAFIGIQGLNAEVEAAEQVLPGHPILRLVAVP